MRWPPALNETETFENELQKRLALQRKIQEEICLIALNKDSKQQTQQKQTDESKTSSSVQNIPLIKLHKNPSSFKKDTRNIHDSEAMENDDYRDSENDLRYEKRRCMKIEVSSNIQGIKGYITSSNYDQNTIQTTQSMGNNENFFETVKDECLVNDYFNLNQHKQTSLNKLQNSANNNIVDSKQISNSSFEINKNLVNRSTSINGSDILNINNQKNKENINCN